MPNSSLPGVNVLLEGPTGTGKTYSLGTLCETGLEVFYLALEPGLESLLGFFTDNGKSIPGNLHYHYLSQPAAGISALYEQAKSISTTPLDTLMKLQDHTRNQRNRWFQIFEQLNNFEDQRTGETFGCVDTWNQSRVLIIDGLSGLTRAAADPVIGKKIAKSQPEIGQIQQVLHALLLQLTDGCQCHFVLISHVDRIIDEVFGGTTIVPSTEGKKLGPQLPQLFSDVIFAERNRAQFSWNTIKSGVDLKTRNLALSDKLPPSFVPLIQKWKSRSGK